MSKQKSASSDVFVVEGVIGSYLKVFTPEPFMQNGQPQGEPFYSMVLLVTPEVAGIINQKAGEVAQAKYTPEIYNHESFGWPCQPANLKPEYANNPRTAGLYMVNAKAGRDYPPQVVDENRQPVLDRGKIYSGAVYAVAINAYTRPQPARPGEVGQGVGIGLKAVMKTADGEPLAGDSVDVNTVFGGVKAQSAPAVPGMPGGASAPAPGAPQPQFGQPTAPAAPGMPAAPFPGQQSADQTPAAGVPGIPGIPGLPQS